MVSPSKTLRPGAPVEIDWGLGTRAGVVETVRTVGPTTYVLVRIAVEGPRGELLESQTISLPSTAVRESIA
jgi:hypothetical protein